MDEVLRAAELDCRGCFLNGKKKTALSHALQPRLPTTAIYLLLRLGLQMTNRSRLLYLAVNLLVAIYLKEIGWRRSNIVM